VGEQHARVDRLGEVIIGPEFQAEHLIEILITRRQHDHRHAITNGTQFAADLESILTGQHDIEDYHVGLQLADPFHGLLTGQFMVNHKTMLVQIVND
jgi:hypothetical protein